MNIGAIGTSPTAMTSGKTPTETARDEAGRSPLTTLNDGIKMAATGALAGVVIGGAVAGVLALRGKMGFQVIRQTSNGGSMVKSFERTVPNVVGKAVAASAAVGALAGVSGLKTPFRA